MNNLTKARVLSQAIWGRSEPNKISDNIIDILFKGDIIDIIETKDDWLKYEKGWVYSGNKESTFVEIIKNTTNIDYIHNPGRAGISTFAEVVGDSAYGGPPVTNVSEEEEYVLDKSNGGYGGDANAAPFIKNVRGIHGMPYQFMASADIRLTDSVFGRKYAEKIVSKMPILLLTPGEPKFMKGFSADSKKNILNYAKEKGGEALNNIDELLGNNKGKIYSFQSNYAEYYAYVNPMCQRMSRYLGINTKKLDDKELGKYEWENYANSEFRNFISNKENISFYIDSDTQISEGFSNSTGESMLDGTVNKLSDMGREVQFMLGSGAGIEFDKMANNATEEFDKWTSKYSGSLPERLIGNIKQGFTSIASGGKMVFPEIWTDSNFSRSYSISIKLRTPDADNLSWFMNIGVPLMHLICLVAPRQLGTNGYKSPFLIRGYYKGFFNCDMGIITDMNISKGAKGRWTTDGLPTEIDVSFTLKDLYQIMSITSDKNPVDLLANTTLLDYIANLCGINVSKPDLERAIDLAYMTITNSVFDKITFDGFIGVENALSNMISSIFKR